MIVQTHWVIFWLILFVAWSGGYISARMNVNDVKKALRFAYKENEFLRSELHNALTQNVGNPSARKRANNK